MTVNSYDAMDGLQVIVDEFERFIKFVEEQKPKLSSKKLHLGKKDAFALNSILQNKRAVKGPHYTQEQYPMIDLLYSLALDGELYVIGNDHKGSIVLTKTPRLEEYMGLNIYEQYIFLLQTYLTAYDFKSKFSRIGLYIVLVSASSREGLLNVLANSNEGEMITREKNNSIFFYFSQGADYLYHLSYFGFCDLELIEEAQFNYEERVRSFTPTSLGIKASRVIKKAIKEYCSNSDIRFVELFFELRDKSKGLLDMESHFFNHLKTIFPKGYVKDTVQADYELDNSGSYTFKVSLAHSKKIWRKIRLSHKHFLYRLHQAIQEAFEFDDDHPYLFCFGSSSIQDGTCIYSYLSDGHMFTTMDYTIGDLGLVKGQRFYYLFDFGRSWWFEVYVTGIDKDSPLPSNYEIIAQNNNKQ